VAVHENAPTVPGARIQDTADFQRLGDTRSREHRTEDNRQFRVRPDASTSEAILDVNMTEARQAGTTHEEANVGGCSQSGPASGKAVLLLPAAPSMPA